MGDHPGITKRRPRVDSVRNRARVLEAAKAVFSAGGPEASLEAVARQAGVGIGTLYRHFPTREALFEAVYRREVEQLTELAETLKTDVSPVEALRSWLRATVEFVATKKGMSAALAIATYKTSDLAAYSSDRLTKAVGGLLDRAIAAGAVRADISPNDLLRALLGMCYAHDRPGWQASVLRLVDVFVDGLRHQPANPPAMSPILAIMGVSGSGKSTVAAALAAALNWPFLEGDDLHPPSNIAKMRADEPLTDDDRLPWLAAIGRWIDARRAAHQPGIVTCSALKHAYRDVLAGHGRGVIFVYLKIPPDIAARRMNSRHGHFMPASLLPSQFGTLEEPTAEEGAIVIDAARPVDAILAEIEERLRPLPPAGA